MSTWHSVCDTMSGAAHVCTDLAHVKNECLSVDHVKLADVHDGISKYSGQSIVASSSPFISVSAYSLDRAVTPGSLLQRFLGRLSNMGAFDGPLGAAHADPSISTVLLGLPKCSMSALSPLVCYDQPRPGARFCLEHDSPLLK